MRNLLRIVLRGVVASWLAASHANAESGFDLDTIIALGQKNSGKDPNAFDSKKKADTINRAIQFREKLGKNNGPAIADSAANNWLRDMLSEVFLPKRQADEEKFYIYLSKDPDKVRKLEKLELNSMKQSASAAAEIRSRNYSGNVDRAILENAMPAGANNYKNFNTIKLDQINRETVIKNYNDAVTIPSNLGAAEENDLIEPSVSQQVENFTPNDGENTGTYGNDSILGYGWDKQTGQFVWSVDGKVVDESHPEVQKFCSDPSKNCPQPGSQSETAATEQEPATDAPAEDLPPQPAPSVETAATGAAPGAIGGMQSAGGNPVVEPGNSIWHGEGGFQGEEYDNNGLNGKSNINQFKLWDSEDLAPQTGSEVQQKADIAERVIDEPVPRGSVYMPDGKYIADSNSDYSSGGTDADSSSFSPSSNSSSQSNKKRNANRNQGYQPRSSRCGPGLQAADYSTPFPSSGPCF